jgi:two-component system chemotaxis response regulator CheB
LLERDVIVIGASSGGVEALRKIAGSLPADLPASVFVVLHIAAESGSMLPEILSRSGPLQAIHPRDGEPVTRGRIYVAPPDHHMMLADGRIRLEKGPRENGHRPAVDPLFQSAAAAFGPRVIGVVLSGSGDDGAAGLLLVKDRGGMAVVQEPADAMFPFMPSAAMLAVDVDASAPADALARVLVEMVKSPASSRPPASRSLSAEEERRKVKQARHDQEKPSNAVQPSMLTCPDCGGVLFDMPEKKVPHFRCHVGHVFSGESLSSNQATVLEEALWSAVRMFQERVALASRLIRDAEKRGLHAVAASFRERVRKANVSAKLIEELLIGHKDSRKEREEVPQEESLPD